MENLNGKKILVTGGTGSYGNALIDYLKDSNVHFVVFSRDEDKQYDMYAKRRNANISYVVGDIRDKQRLLDHMKGIDYVIHAAALKHVPTGERFPSEVINTNIWGTKNVIDVAEICRVKKVVILSSDKATMPICVYGMSKAIAEKIVASHQGMTIITCLRYGNVLGSRGSVIPLFLSFINNKQPLTVTNPNMTRFVITLEEAVKLSLRCLHSGDAGDLFIMKPPACTLATIIEALELNFGKAFKKKIIGIRAGEKMHEALLTGAEVHKSIEEQEQNIDYARLPAQREVDYYFYGEDYVEPEAYTSDKARQYNARQVLAKLKEAKLL